MGEPKDGDLRLDSDRRLKLEFHGSKVTFDAGYRQALDMVPIGQGNIIVLPNEPKSADQPEASA